MTKEFYMGRKPSPLDIRDYDLKEFMPQGFNWFGLLRTNRYWPFGKSPLDQGPTNHCVGFSMANFGINEPIVTNYTEEDGHKFYRLCKIKDGEPDSEEGSNIRTAAGVLKDLGKIKGYAFAPNIDIVKWWILNRGPMMVGTWWTVDMFTPNEYNIIRPTGEVAGGHAYLINEITDTGLMGIQNSWGMRWGKYGRAYISIADFSILFRNGGEALAAVEV